MQETNQVPEDEAEPEEEPAPVDEGENIDDPNDADESDTVVNEETLNEPAENEGEEDPTGVDDDENTEQRLEESSPSPALEIEGVVTGEADEGGVQSEGGNFREADESEVHICVC